MTAVIHTGEARDQYAQRGVIQPLRRERCGRDRHTRSAAARIATADAGLLSTTAGQVHQDGGEVLRQSSMNSIESLDGEPGGWCFRMRRMIGVERSPSYAGRGREFEQANGSRPRIESRRRNGI